MSVPWDKIDVLLILHKPHKHYGQNHDDHVDYEETERILGSLFGCVAHAATSLRLLRVIFLQGAPPSVRYAL